MEETEKKTSDQEADDLKGTGREGIQLAKELGQVIKKSAGNNAGSLFESEKGEGIPAPLQGGQNPLDLSHTKDASSITGDSATTERGRKTVGQGMLPDRNSSPQNGRAPQKRGEIPKPQRGTSLQGAKKTANASGAALVELFFGNVSSGQGSVLLDADENGIPQVPYIHQGFGVYDFTSNSYTHTEILSHSFPDGTIAVNDSASTQRTYWTNGKKGWTKAQIDACESGYPTYTILVCPDAMKKRENRNAKAEAIVQACHAVPSPGMGLCAAWVTNVYRTAGAGNPVGDARDMYAALPERSEKEVRERKGLSPGMIVALKRCNGGSDAQTFDHVGIYIGGGKIMDNVGRIETQDLEVYHLPGRDANAVLLTFEEDRQAAVLQERTIRGEISYNFYGEDASTVLFVKRQGILVKDASEAEMEVDRINRKDFTQTAANQETASEDPVLWDLFQDKIDARICIIQYVTGNASDYGITHEGRFLYEATVYDGTLPEGTGSVCGIQVDTDGEKNIALLIQNDGKRIPVTFTVGSDGAAVFGEEYR